MNPVVPLPFPKGNNDTDTVLAGVHFNLTALQNNSYLLYPNNTLSNDSNCVLVFNPYTPVYLFPNGTFVNSTSCYVSILPMGTRSYVGIGLAVLYGIMLVLSITALAKHGRQYIKATKRFYPVGRRWQWYWALFVCACGLISLFLNVDVDRYYVQELPIVITCFFWFLVCQGTTALVWEAVRHWGSWQERQYVDPDPFILKMDDRRSKVEFWLPMWFYLWTWLNFFMVIPRNWTFVELQRSPQQIEEIAIPGAMDGRFKAGAFCLVISWLTIVFSLYHSIKHYKARDRGVFNRARGFLTNIPLRLALLIVLDAALIAYQIFMSFSWKYSLFRLDGEVGAQFGWGYGPSILIMIVQIVHAAIAPNEDKELLRQRRERGAEVDRDLGLIKQPDWWRRVRGEHIQGTLRDRIKKNVTEVGGVHGTGRRAEDEIERHLREEEAGIRMEDNPPMSANNPRADRAGARAFTTASSLPSQSAEPTAAAQYQGRSENRHSETIIQSAASMLFPNADRSEEEARARRLAALQEDTPPPPYSPNQNGRTNSTSTTVSAAQPQQIRSMLDV